MAVTLTKKKTIEEIVKEAKKLDKMELQILLTKLRVKKMINNGVKPAANPPKGINMPTMQEIDRWKHAARKQYAGKQICS